MSIKNLKYLIASGLFCASVMAAANETKDASKDTSKSSATESKDASKDDAADYVEFVVNGKTIRHSEIVRVFSQAVPPQEMSKMSQEQIASYKRYVENMLIANILFREQAEKTHVERDKEFRAALQKYKESLMVTFYIQKFLRDRIQQGNVIAKISQIEPELKKKREKKVCFIVTNSEESAKKAIADLVAGKDFVATAKLYSVLQNDEAKEQAAKGAYMPVMEKMPMLPEEISVAINSLENGKFTTEPVKAGSDYYVIKIADERALQLPKEAVAKIAYQQLRADELKTLISNLIAAAAIKRMNEKGTEIRFERRPINAEEIVRPAS